MVQGIKIPVMNQTSETTKTILNTNSSTTKSVTIKKRSPSPMRGHKPAPQSELTSCPSLFPKAKQRASICWLISKACDDKDIPREYLEPFYKDHHGEDRLKPRIVQALASAELYCLVLAAIYSDPNYNSLSHNGIIQVLMRKGIYVVDPHDSSLTESILIQDSPIKMSAHMVVIESLMSLYIKEVLIAEKVIEVVHRFLPIDDEEELPEEPEDAALFWINKCNLKLMARIEEEMANATPTDDMNDGTIPPMAPVEYLWDLSDGKSLASVIALYAPTSMSWKEICYNEPTSPADCVYNLQMVQLFCNEHLPVDIFFMSVEDFFDCHRLIRPNILAFIADLLYHFEIKPANCVHRPVVDDEDNFLLSDGDDEDIEDEDPSTTSSSNSGHRSASNGGPGHGHEKRTPMNALIQNTRKLRPSSASTPRVKRHPLQTSDRRGHHHRNLDHHQDHHYADDDAEDADEEMTRYFSAIDLDPDFDSSPEIILLPKNDPYNSMSNTRTRKTSSTATTSGVTGSGASTTYNSNNLRSSRTSRRSENDGSSNGFDVHSESMKRSSRPSSASTSGAKRPSQPPNYPSGDPFYGQHGHGHHHQPLNGSGNRFATYNKYQSPGVGHPFQDGGRHHSGHQANRSIYDKSRMMSMNRSVNDLPAAGLLRRSNSNSQTFSRQSSGSKSREFMDQGTPNRRHGSSMADLPSASSGRVVAGAAGWSRTQYKPFDTSPFPPPTTSSSYHYPPSQQQQFMDRRTSRGSGCSSTEHSPDRQSFNRGHHHQQPPIRRSNSTRTVDRRSSGGHQRYDNYGHGHNYGHPDDNYYDGDDGYEPSPGYHEEYVDDHHHQQQHQQQRRGSFGTVPRQRLSNDGHQMSPIDTHIESQVYSDSSDQQLKQQQFKDDLNYRGHDHQQQHQQSMFRPPPRSEQFRRRNSREDTLMERSYEGEELVNQRQQLINNQRMSPSKDVSSKMTQFKDQNVDNNDADDDQKEPRELPADHANRRNTWYVSNDHHHSSSGRNKLVNNQDVPSTSSNNLINNRGTINKLSRESNLRPSSLFIPWDSHDGQELSGKISKSSSSKGQLHRPSSNNQDIKSQIKRTSNEMDNNSGGNYHQQQHVNNSVQCVQDKKASSPTSSSNQQRPTTPGVGFVIGKDISEMDQSSELSMAKKKELIIEQSLKRKAEQEAKRVQKQEELAKKKEEESKRREEAERKKEEEKQRKSRILEEYKLKKAAEEDEKIGGTGHGTAFTISLDNNHRPGGTVVLGRQRLRPASATGPRAARPKSMLHVNSSFMKDFSSLDQKPSSVTDSSTSRTLSKDGKGSNNGLNFGNSTGSVRTLSATSSTQLTSPSTSSSTQHLPQFGMPSMPPLFRARGPPSEAGSDVGSAFGSEYNGPKLFVKPSQKTNRVIIINAINSVLAGAVNADMKKKCLEEVQKSDGKHFLILFRGAGLQFRAIYTYCLDTEVATKLHGSGPRTIVNDMMDKYYKFNSGSKKFVPIETKHMSITIDAIAIHNYLWPAPKPSTAAPGQGSGTNSRPASALFQ